MTNDQTQQAPTEGKNDGFNGGATQHTPGPWKANFTDGAEWHGVENTDVEHDGGLIAKVYGTDEFPCVEATDQIRAELAANARLIAAAPDLLMALEYTRKAIRTGEFGAGEMAQVDRIIANARGTSR